ncbi:hypothetical protein FRC12_016029, partial [Ceratobasidium sp. 428]
TMLPIADSKIPTAGSSPHNTGSHSDNRQPTTDNRHLTSDSPTSLPFNHLNRAPSVPSPLPAHTQLALHGLQFPSLLDNQYLPDQAERRGRT